MPSTQGIFIMVLYHFLNVIDVVQGAQGLNDLAVRFVFLQLFAADGDRNGIYAQSRMLISRIHFNVVDLHSKLANGGNKVLQIGNVFQLQMYFKVVGAIFEVTFHTRKNRKRANEYKVRSDGNGVKACTDAQAKQGTCPKGNRGCQALDLATRAIKNRVNGDDGNRNDACRRNEVKSAFGTAQKEEVKQHCKCCGKGYDHKGTQSCRVTLGGTLKAEICRKCIRYIMRFLGNSEAKTDAKGRVFLPAIFRKQLQAAAEECLIMRKDTYQNCLILYPESAWNNQMNELRSRLNRWNQKHQMIFRQFVSDVEIITLDANGRFLIPKRYQKLANIQQEVRIIGMDDTIEIWPKETVDQPFMAPEEFEKELEAIMGIAEEF